MQLIYRARKKRLTAVDDGEITKTLVGIINGDDWGELKCGGSRWKKLYLLTFQPMDFIKNLQFETMFHWGQHNILVNHNHQKVLVISLRCSFIKKKHVNYILQNAQNIITHDLNEWHKFIFGDKKVYIKLIYFTKV